MPLEESNIRKRHGSPKFYELLGEMADTHDKKSHDYASNSNPYGNYHFAGKVAVLFAHSEQDAGFVGRIAEKIYRLANLESSQKTPSNESIEDTERDICVITLLWMAGRRERRADKKIEEKQVRTDIENMTVAEKEKLLNTLLDERRSGAWE